MTKIMLVEDDKSLREIYSIRLVAEGYEVVSAGDGEEALATAVQQQPDLILSDVMMPKISGFDMLDILRSTPETKDIKVIMMTALSSEDQRQRGENLGADKYLVKSQVGIEDVINAVHEVLADKNTAPGTAPTTAQPMGAQPEVGAQPAATPETAPAAGVQPAAPETPATAPAPATSEVAPVTPAAPEAATAATPAAEASAAPATPETPAAAPQMGAQPAEAVAPAEAPAAATEPATPAPAETPAVPETPTTSEAAPADAQAQPQNATAEAMEALLNNTPDTPNATWPGNTSQ